MKILQDYNLSVDDKKLKTNIDKIKQESEKLQNTEVYNRILNIIDLTTLTETDNETKIQDMCKKVNDFNSKFSHISNVAAICVYPSMVPYVKKH